MYFTSEADLEIKAGFCQPLQYIRAGAPRYKGARPYSCGRTAETSKNVLFSLLPSAFLPVCRLFYPSCKACPFFRKPRSLPHCIIVLRQDIASDAARDRHYFQDFQAITKLFVTFFCFGRQNRNKMCNFVAKYCQSS